MSISSKINHLSQFLETLNSYDISIDDVCIVGSATLAIHGIRSNNDIDFCTKSAILKSKFPDLTSTTKLSSNIELLLSQKYNRFFRIQDDEIIENPKYHIVVNGIKFIRLELEFAAKLVMQREKDKQDIKQIIEHSSQHSTWDWKLVPDKIETIGSSPKVPPSRLQRVKNSLKSPKQIPEKVLRKLADYTRNRQNYKIQQEKALQERLNFSRKLLEDLDIQYPIDKLLALQYSGDKYNRMDTIVRLLAVEDFHGINDYGFYLYNKMQEKRGAIKGYTTRFRSLLENVNTNGYKRSSSIHIDSYGKLKDGSHRLSIACYYHHRKIPVKITESKFETVYDIQWFAHNGFTNKECEIIEERKHKLFFDFGLYFPIILWPSCSPHFIEIENEIAQSYPIIKKTDFHIEGYNFEDFCERIYKIDDIQPWKIARKIAFLKEYIPSRTMVLWIDIANPEYRKKQINNNDISQKIERLKRKIRTNFKNKIPNYVHDIIIHAGDNYEHNREINKILTEILP